MFDEFNNLILKPVRFPLEEKVAKSKEEILKELAKKMDSEKWTNRQLYISKRERRWIEIKNIKSGG